MDSTSSRQRMCRGFRVDLQSDKGPRLHGLRGCRDRKSTRLNSSHSQISYAVFCLKKKKIRPVHVTIPPPCPAPTELPQPDLAHAGSRNLASLLEVRTKT